MITHPTVLVLGAGASAPYGFPTGAELRSQIIGELACPVASPLGKTLMGAGFREQQIQSFADEFGNSAWNSVDQFLEHRPDHLSVGKAAIAAALIPHETMGKLFRAVDPEEDWYRYLFNAMACSFDEFQNNKLSIITYNYDRSLEQHWLKALLAFNKPVAVCYEKLKSIPILHLHGTLGEFINGPKNYRPYSDDSTPDMITRASDSILIIHETNHASAGFGRARELIQAAERICFLGFGYDQRNVERLVGTDRLFQNKILTGTAYGLTWAEKYSAHSRLATYVPPFFDDVSEEWDCRRLLRESGILTNFLAKWIQIWPKPPAA